MSQSTIGLLRRGISRVVGSLAFLLAVHAWHDYRMRVEPLFSCVPCEPQAKAALMTQARSSFWFGEAGNRVYLFNKTNLGAEKLSDFGPLLLRMPDIPLMVVLGRALDAHGKQAHADHITNRLREAQSDAVQKGLKSCAQPSQEFFCRKAAADLSVEEMLRAVEIR